MINVKTAKKYCNEDLSLIENYDKASQDTERMWHCHHRAEILPCGRFGVEDLKLHGLYYNRPSSELIFLTSPEHRRLHMVGNKITLGMRFDFSAEHRHNLSIAQKGKVISEETKRKIGNYFRGRKLSEEHKEKVRKAIVGHDTSDKTRKRIMMSNPNRKKILLLSADNKVIQQFNSMREAERITGISHEYIGMVCRGEIHNPSTKWRLAGT